MEMICPNCGEDITDFTESDVECPECGYIGQYDLLPINHRTRGTDKLPITNPKPESE